MVCPLFLSEPCFHLLLISVHTDQSRSMSDRCYQSSAHVRPVHTIIKVYNYQNYSVFGSHLDMFALVWYADHLRITNIIII